ncbi:hypothetical protein [Sulfuracidifex tepidarius]|nr:hypothetical protein [Sulfuracidifex tepidarius]
MIVVAAVAGFLIGERATTSPQASTTIVTSSTTSTVTESVGYIGDPPASVGNGEDYLINPVFPAHTIASQYGYVTYGNGRVFIGGLYSSGNGYLAGAKGAAVIASMFAGQPLTSYDYYLYITAPSPINVGGAVKTDSATVMFLASMLGQESYLNKSMYFLGDVGLEGYMYSTGVVYQRIVQLNQGGIYYLVVPKMMALAEGQNYQMAQEYAKQHNETLYTVCDIPQIYEIETSQQVPQAHGYIDFQANLSSGYEAMVQVYNEFYAHANSSEKGKANQYYQEAQKLASEGDYFQFYVPNNPMVMALESVYNGSPIGLINEAETHAEESYNLWAIETSAEAEYLYHGNLSDMMDSIAWAGLSISLSAGPTITPYGLYQGVYNAYVMDMYAAEYYDAITGSSYGNVSLLTDVMNNPNLLYDYGFLANYYATLAMNLSNYFIKQLNSTAQGIVESSIQHYMENEVSSLQSQAAYFDGPSLVGYILMNDGSTYSLYHAMPFIRMSENTEELTWYNAV